jgi:glycosyltransferase involved in cell wall biosynthesis
MRLAIATPLYPPESGGPATYSKLLEEGLPSEGVEVELVKFSEVRHLPKLIRHYAYYRRVKLAARRADAVLALDPVSTGFAAMRAARKAGKPFILKIVGDYAWEQGAQRFGITATLDEFVNMPHVPAAVAVFRKVQTRVAAAAVQIIVPSEYLKKIVTAWGIPPEKIAVIYNAVPPEETGTVPAAVAALPRPLVVTAGRLVPWKHIDGVVEAVSQTNASLAIVGDGPLAAMLAELATAKLAGRSALTGRLSHADTLAVIKGADVFVLNSSYEGLSHLLIETLALGTPIIATRVGGNPEVIEDGVNGLLVPAGDAGALTEAIARVLGDAELRARLRVRAQESATRFSVRTMIPATAKLLASLV